VDAFKISSIMMIRFVLSSSLFSRADAALATTRRVLLLCLLHLFEIVVAEEKVEQ
jgi:hypothetical protein